MKKRILSALVATIIAIPVITIGGNLFYLVVSILGLIAMLEMIKAKEKEKELPLVIKGITMLSFIVLLTYDWFIFINIKLEHILIFILFITIMPIIAFKKKNAYTIIDALFMFGVICLLGLGFNSLALLRNDSPSFFIYVISITIITDTFAYIGGTLIGKHKMCPNISPNKTWEGFICGLVMCSIASPIIIYNLNHASLIKIIPLTILLSVVAQLGDLVFSSIKRHFKIKDYGNFMPGHGGVLDRFDSLLFVGIVYSLISRFL